MTELQVQRCLRCHGRAIIKRCSLPGSLACFGFTTLPLRCPHWRRFDSVTSTCLPLWMLCQLCRHCPASVGPLSLTESELLGEGAFSRVSEVVEDGSKRTFALKRMTKSAALQCPEHVYCEQHISKNTANAFCIRQYASFKVCGWWAGQAVMYVLGTWRYVWTASLQRTGACVCRCASTGRGSGLPGLW